jgi:hypothetical protein
MTDIHNYQRDRWVPNATHALTAARGGATRQAVAAQLQEWGATVAEAHWAIEQAIQCELLHEDGDRLTTR